MVKQLNSVQRLLSLVIVCLFFSSNVYAVVLKEHPKLQQVADQLIAENYYTQAELDAIFLNATVQQSVLKAMTSPAEYKFTWGKYRKLFLQQDRIQQGVDFWLQYESEMQRAEQKYGVPASVIAAIIGVESKYGKYKGKHKVLDSLVTLVVGFERRSKFFAKELKQYLILTKENQLAVDAILGSYAGAVGYPQFISSSYRTYAVDFSGDGITDLINQPIDAIGSVANYFVENGWLSGQPVTSTAHFDVPVGIADLANRKRKIQFSAEQLRAKGARLNDAIRGDEKLNVLMLNANEIVNEPKKSGTYIVRAGDTVCEIAEKFNVSCKLLIKINKLNSKGTIFRDQKLKLPTSLSSSKSSNTSKTTDKASDKWTVSGNKNAGKPNRESTLEKDAVHPRYFYTHENFYVITRYNHSVLYAMAVHDLSLAIASAMQERQATEPQTVPVND